MTRRGFPHSDIPGSKLVCSSPRHIAAYRVLHRLLAPRHSPYALSSLTIGFETDARRTAPTIARRTGANGTNLSSQPSLEHCMFLWIGKNYRLQNIQLSKSSRGTRVPPDPSLAYSRGPKPHAVCEGRTRRRAETSLRERQITAPSTHRHPSPARPTLARQPQRRAPRAIREGWWRIPGSNR